MMVSVCQLFISALEPENITPNVQFHSKLLSYRRQRLRNSVLENVEDKPKSSSKMISHIHGVKLTNIRMFMSKARRIHVHSRKDKYPPDNRDKAQHKLRKASFMIWVRFFSLIANSGVPP